MLSALLLATLIATPPPPADDTQVPTKLEITKAFKMLEEDTNIILRQLPNRLGFDPAEPKLGVTLETRELGLGADGLLMRHTYVSSVFVPSGAHTADIQPGDRIAAIGEQRLETELPRAVMFYMEDHPDGIPLTIERNGNRFATTLRPEPILCARSVWNAFEVATWQNSVTKLRTLIRGKIAAIEGTPTLTMEQHNQACIDVVATKEFIRAIVVTMARELEPSLSSLCTVQRSAP
ncbi:MAG: hypothetical protein IT405_00375 [Candidatus Yanofskybacteria bacterium]|nr:hypothetical protein [Candidatus Yanofskybacteria bacterium]